MIFFQVWKLVQLPEAPRPELLRAKMRTYWAKIQGVSGTGTSNVLLLMALLALLLMYLIIYLFITFYWAGFYSCPEGKGTRALQGPIQRCPTFTPPPPPFAYERQPQHRDHPTLFEWCVGSFTSHRIINIQGIVRRDLRLIVLIRED